MIRIIAGKYKGRTLAKGKGGNYRPSTAKVREAIFSMLASGKYAPRDFISNTEVLDLFTGTGGLAFEALSRGALRACLIDIDQGHLKDAKRFAEMLDAPCDIMCVDAQNLPISSKQYGLVFLDPPYGKNMIPHALSSLINKNWLKADAIVIAEMERREIFLPIAQLNVLEEKIYGKSKIIIMRYEQV